MNVAFLTLGCPKNEVDTEAMQTSITAVGWQVLDGEDALSAADVVVVNTCAFIQDATEASIAAVLDAAKECADGRLVVVTGCLVNRYSDELAKELPEVAAFVPIGEEERIVEILSELLACPDSPSAPIPEIPASRPYAYLKIADGCDRCCAYCTIPAIRGPYRSRAQDDIVAEARAKAAAGTREFVLIAQDTGRYGCDLPQDAEGCRPTLLTLLDELSLLPGVERLRLMYLQPEGLTEKLLQCMAEHPTIAPYLEVPLQHCEPRLLKLMGRGANDAQRFEKALVRARELMPHLALRTTLIAGFPSETQAEFDALCAFVRRIGFDYVGVFAYSPEDGTPAAELPDQLPEVTRRARAQILRDIGDELGWKKAAEHVGEQVEVLIEGFDDEEEYWWGRAPEQAPEIDGIVRIAGLDPLLQIGSLVKVRLVDSILYDWEGETFG